MTREEFKSNMALIRAELKQSKGTRATALCMVVAATRGHVHAAHVWQRLEGWRGVGATVGTLAGQREFIFANAKDPWGVRLFSEIEWVMVLHTVEAADDYRGSWAQMADIARHRAEQPVPVA